MSIIVVKNSVAGNKYIHPFVPEDANWSKIKLKDEIWNTNNAIPENEIYVDCDDNASVAELGDMVNMIRNIVRFFGRLLKALPVGTSFGSVQGGVYWLTTFKSTAVKEIRVKHACKGKVSDAYTYFRDKNNALIIANAIKFAFAYYGIDAYVVDK